MERRVQERRRLVALRTTLRQREEEIQQHKGELQEQEQKLEQLKAMTMELSPYDLVGERVLHREDQELLERIFQIITERVAEPELSPKTIADELCMGYRTLYRRIQEISDKTLATMIREIRMERARQLLTQTKMTVEQVALEVGYINRGSFYKHFASQFGCTPRQFQANFTAEVVSQEAESVRKKDKDDGASQRPATPVEGKE